jgi:hypothetical protein
MEDFVHEYYFVDMMRKTYTSVFNPMASKHQWSRVDLGYKNCKPKLRRNPGRPRVSRIKASNKASNNKKRKYTECNELDVQPNFVINHFSEFYTYLL